MLSGTLNSHGNIPMSPDIKPFGYEYQIGFETLVVHTVNQWASYVH